MNDQRTYWLTTWLNNLLLVDWLKAWRTHWLKEWLPACLPACLADYVPGSKAFPHVLLHGAFQLGNAASSLHIVYSVEPSRGSEAPLHLYTRPETPLLRPPLISNRDFLSRLSFFSLLYAHRHTGWGHSERVNRCWLICPRLSDIARVMYLMWSLFSSNKRIKN